MRENETPFSLKAFTGSLHYYTVLYHHKAHSEDPEEGMLPSPCKWEGRWPWNEKEQDKKKLKQGGVSVRVERPDRLKALPYEENKKALSSYSFLIEFPLFFFFFSFHKNKTENSKLYQQPTLCVCVSFLLLFPSWSRHPFVFWSHLVVICYTAMQSIRFHSTTKHKTLKETKQPKKTFFESLYPLSLLILFKFSRWIFFPVYFSYPYPCHQRKWNKCRV